MLLLFISCLAIFILRVAHFHFGERVSKSPADTLARCLQAPPALETFAFYLFSAWWFSEVYVWSVPSSSELHWVVEGKYVKAGGPLLSRPDKFADLMDDCN